MTPEVGQTRNLKNSDGSITTITIAQVETYPHGENAYSVYDTEGRYWLFASK